MKDSGYLYILINTSFDGLLKIGKTNRNSHERAKELSSATGVPTPFIVAFDVFVSDCTKAESYVHSLLEQQCYRLSQNREFFNAPLSEGIKCLLEVKDLFVCNENINNTNNFEEIREIKKDYSFDVALSTYIDANQYLTGNGDFLINVDKGINLLEKSARFGIGRAYIDLGIIYSDIHRESFSSHLPKPDNKKALSYFKAALDMGLYGAAIFMIDIHEVENNVFLAKKTYEFIFKQHEIYLNFIPSISNTIIRNLYEISGNELDGLGNKIQTINSLSDINSETLRNIFSSYLGNTLNDKDKYYEEGIEKFEIQDMLEEANKQLNGILCLDVIKALYWPCGIKSFNLNDTYYMTNSDTRTTYSDGSFVGTCIEYFYFIFKYKEKIHNETKSFLLNYLKACHNFGLDTFNHKRDFFKNESSKWEGWDLDEKNKCIDRSELEIDAYKNNFGCFSIQSKLILLLEKEDIRGIQNLLDTDYNGLRYKGAETRINTHFIFCICSSPFGFMSKPMGPLWGDADFKVKAMYIDDNYIVFYNHKHPFQTVVRPRRIYQNLKLGDEIYCHGHLNYDGYISFYPDYDY